MITGVARLQSNARAGSAEEKPEDSVRDPQFHGNYPKYSISIANVSYIAKLGKTNDYNLIALAETITNKIAVLLGMNVPEFCLINWKKRPCFVVKNFMSGATPSNLVHLENLWPKLADGRMTEYFLPELMGIVKQHAGYRAEAQIVELVIFDYLIGNADRHRGNIAFIQDKKGMRLAPIYDNVTDLGLEMEDFLSANDKVHPAMRILVEGATIVDAKTYLSCHLKSSFKDLVERRFHEIIAVSEELKWKL
ncbi:MAG: HipA domain-containing protein [Proteobacteria bacterium]|nr:HipA domain-containing protein [Pseudomonadota bacterium]